MPAPRLRRLPTWVRSGPTTPSAGVPRTVWQAPQPLARNSSWPRAASGCVGRLCRRVLVREPGGEVRLAPGRRRRSHQGVRGAAVLGAGAAEDAGARRLERQAVRAPRNHVDLAAEGRNPERVDDVGALQVKLHRLADRQADLVGELDASPLPPGVR